jgi:hypothetical protein
MAAFMHKNINYQCYNYVSFEVYMAVTMKNSVFWDVMSCGSCKNRRFGEVAAPISLSLSPGIPQCPCHRKPRAGCRLRHCRRLIPDH